MTRERVTEAERVRQACIRAALEAYESAGMSGLCEEGRWEAAVDAMRRLDLDRVEPPAAPARRITGFRTDDEGHWVAELECGHGQHVRHDPPWQVRPWVLTPEGRAGMLGTTLACRRCTAAGQEQGEAS